MGTETDAGNAASPGQDSKGRTVLALLGTAVWIAGIAATVLTFYR